MFDWLEFNDPRIQALIAWLGLLGTLVGIILAVVFYKRLPRPRPAYRFHTLKILEADDKLSREGISILYEDQQIQRLAKTIIVIWNAGRSALKSEEVRTGYPVGWAFPSSTTVLRVRVLRTTREANHFDAYKDPADPYKVVCKFDYLNSGDGALLEVLHTGDKQDPKPIGEILNMSKPFASRGPLYPQSPKPLSESAQSIRTNLYAFTVKTPRGQIRPFPPLFRALNFLRIILWNLIKAVGGIFLVTFALRSRSVYNFMCTPPAEGTTLEECTANVPFYQWFFGAIGALVFLSVVSDLLRRAPRRYPSALDPRDLL